MLLFGIGSWIPGLPDRLNTKLNAISALETIQYAVADATGKPWPGPDYRARSTVAAASVSIWFERGTNKQLIEHAGSGRRRGETG